MNLDINQFKDAIRFPAALQDSMVLKLHDGSDNPFYYEIRTVNFKESLDNKVRNHQNNNPNLLTFNQCLLSFLNNSIKLFNSK
jgi:hypothetical protein